VHYKHQIIIANNATELAINAADVFLETARDCVRERDRFAVALSGGSTPHEMHRMLAEEPYGSDVPWEKVHIFWVDERCVPVDDPASNYGAAKKEFLDRIPIPAEQIHPMPGHLPPEEGVMNYRKALKAFFRPEGRDHPAFDLIFLGVGKDGHTASLFPGHRSLETEKGWVAAVKGGEPDVYRLTFTYKVLNQAKHIYFMVSGKGKAPIVKTIFEKRDAQLPAQKIQPVNGKLTWLLDQDAASLLSGEIKSETS
jgi:6-phosphogluconolactonase